MNTRRILIAILVVAVLVFGVVFYMKNAPGGKNDKKLPPAPPQKPQAAAHWVCNPATLSCRQRPPEEKNIAKGEVDYFPASGVTTKDKCLAACAKEKGASHWVCNMETGGCRLRSMTEKDIAKGERDYFPASGIATREQCLSACAKAKENVKK